MRKLGPAFKIFEHRRIKPEAKTVDPFYLSPEYREWRDLVIRRAGGRCEAVDQGKRCIKAQPQYRMFADHIRERRDGGAQLDPANGQCLCGSHHTLKTTKVRAERLSSRSA